MLNSENVAPECIYGVAFVCAAILANGTFAGIIAVLVIGGTIGGVLPVQTPVIVCRAGLYDFAGASQISCAVALV